MKHIKLFENFETDQVAIDKVLSAANEEWFINGEDAPDEFRTGFENFQSEDEELSNLIQLCMEGPGYTDMWIEQGELISDILEEDPDVSEEDIYDSNKEWFAAERQKALGQLSGRFNIGFGEVK